MQSHFQNLDRRASADVHVQLFNVSEVYFVDQCVCFLFLAMLLLWKVFCLRFYFLSYFSAVVRYRRVSETIPSVDIFLLLQVEFFLL